MQLLRTLAIIILVYYGFKFLARYIFPILLKMFVNKAQKNMQNQFRQQDSPQRPEGEVTIDKTSDKERIYKGRTDVEDVDFEEID